MNRLLLAALVCVGVLGTIGPARSHETAAVFPVSSVESVDVRNQMLAFKTADGRLWLMRVADPAAMRRESLVKGDLVSLEVDLDEQIVRIVKLARPKEQESRWWRFK